MSGAVRRPGRLRQPYVERLAERLSDRDWDILFTLHRVRLATGLQLERLHFHELTGRSRVNKRSLTLKRLVVAGVLVPLGRRVGTANRGSVQQTYALDSAGQRLVRLRMGFDGKQPLVRRPRVPSDRLTKHTLAVTELYVELVERARSGGFSLDEFLVEGTAYWPDGQGGWVKPDAFVRLRRGKVTDYWWYEADMPRHESDLANESLPTTRRKMLVYLDFANRGQKGPDDTLPRVIFGEPTAKRQQDVQGVIDELPTPAGRMFRVTELSGVAQVVVSELTK